ncbi:MAG: membrane protein insertion efficiency factor YidD, partial [Micromonosporaceae bacterium]
SGGWFRRWGVVGWSAAVSSVVALTMLVILVVLALPRGRRGCGGRAAPEPSASPSPVASPTPTAEPGGLPSAEPTGTGGTGGGSCDPGESCDAACDSMIEDACDSMVEDVCGGMVEDVCGGSCGGCSSYLDPGVQTYAELLTVLPAMMAVRARPTVPARLGVLAIRGYQRWLSPRLAVHCRYTPTCSQYGLLAIQRYGLAAGARLAYARIHRCTHRVPYGTPDPLPVGTG